MTLIGVEGVSDVPGAPQRPPKYLASNGPNPLNVIVNLTLTLSTPTLCPTLTLRGGRDNFHQLRGLVLNWRLQVRQHDEAQVFYFGRINESAAVIRGLRPQALILIIDSLVVVHEVRQE